MPTICGAGSSLEAAGGRGGRRPIVKASDKPASRVTPAVIRAGELYSLAELRRRLRWKEHAVRQARVNGLRLISFGREKFCLGSDVLKFFERLGERQQAGNGERGNDDTDDHDPSCAHHLDDLRRSGLTDATIAAAGIYSEVL